MGRTCCRPLPPHGSAAPAPAGASAGYRRLPALHHDVRRCDMLPGAGRSASSFSATRPGISSCGVCPSPCDASGLVHQRQAMAARGTLRWQTLQKRVRNRVVIALFPHGHGPARNAGDVAVLGPRSGGNWLALTPGRNPAPGDDIRLPAGPDQRIGRARAHGPKMAPVAAKSRDSGAGAAMRRVADGTRPIRCSLPADVGIGSRARRARGPHPGRRAAIR